MNFLVTGGAGFIGSHVCERLLRAGHAVTALDNLNDFYDPAIKRRNLREVATHGKSFVSVEADIADAAALRKIFQTAAPFDQIIHLAARAGVRPSLEHPALYQRVNVEGTTNILEVAREHGIKKLILASSSSVYGVNSKTPFAEGDPIFSPISPYAASKLACEALGHVYHHLHGMDIAMLRFFTVYGPRQRPDLAIHKFARRIHSGQPIEVFGDGSTARDYTYVSDIVDGIVACAERPLRFEIINLGGSHPITLSRLIEVIESALQKKAVIKRLPDQPGDVPRTWADVTKAAKLLGYAPKISIEEGVQRFVTWLHTCKD